MYSQSRLVVHVTRTVATAVWAISMLALSTLPASGAPIVYKGVSGRPGDPCRVMLEAFKDALELYTNYGVRVDIYNAGTFGSQVDEAKGVRTGVPTFSLPATNNLSLLSPSFGGALSLPYLFRSEDELYALMKAPIWEEFQKKLTKEAGVKALAMGVVGFRWILNSKRPIVTVADIKGLKLRVPDVPQYIAAYKSWGVPPTPMAWNETPAALQQGVIDGLDNAVGTHLAFKFYESAKYLTEINYALLTCPLIMGATQFEQQPPNVRDAIVQAAKDAQNWEYRTYKYTKQIDIKALEAHGVKVNKIKGEEDLERMARSTWPELAARSGGSDWVKRVSEAVANIRRQ